MGVTSLIFSIEGQKDLEPKEWEDLGFFFSFGQFSNQPVIASEKFTFGGNSARVN